VGERLAVGLPAPLRATRREVEQASVDHGDGCLWRMQGRPEDREDRGKG
jgi:hypothetical protein